MSESIRAERAELQEILDEREQVRGDLKRTQRSLETARTHARYVEEARLIIQTLGEKIQNQVHDRLRQSVSQCLDAVFEDAYTFDIIFEKKRGRTEARMIFERNGFQLDPMEQAGLGTTDVASFALRISCLSFQAPAPSRILILDEPFKWVSPGFREHVREMFRNTIEGLGYQLILITHDPIFRIGDAVEIKSRLES